MKTHPLVDITDHKAIADAIGDARAELAKAKSRLALLEDLLKADHVRQVDGDRHRVTIAYDIATQRTDWKAIAVKLQPSRQLVTAHTRRTITPSRVTCKALNKH